MHNSYGTALCKREKHQSSWKKDQVMDKVIRKRRKKDGKRKKDKAEDTDGSFPQGGSFLYPDISV